MSSRADEFKEAYQNLQLQPLITEAETRRFRVPYAENLLDELETMVRDCVDSNNQLIFAGHRGCGKSTFLARFSETIQQDFFVVFFSISDLIEMSDINHITILFAVALQLMAEATQRSISIPQDKIAAFHDWFKTHTKTETNTFGAGVEAGFNLFDIIKGNLKTDAQIREEITTTFTRHFRDLINTIDAIAVEVKLACQKEIIVIIDDIDKLDLGQINQIFQNNIKALLQPRFIVIYTIPIATIRDAGLKKHIEDESGNSIFLMPVQKLMSKGSHRQSSPQVLTETLETLKRILTKRLKPDLMADGIADQIVLFSGGVLREVIRIAQECCRLVRIQILRKQRILESIETIQIDQNILDAAFGNLRNSMAITLSESDRLILKTVYDQDVPKDPKQQEFLDLLHAIYVIEYRNRNSWYGVHPLMIEQLREESLL